FWGWPSYWNVFFFYAWALELPPYPTAVASWVLGACVFAPIPFAYPSKFPVLRKVTWVLAGVWMMTLLLYLISPEFDQIWLIGSLAFPVYYLAISGYFHEELAD
ncbi:MAG: CDP-diacylglycerol O-phosphatidyltransferase, partial [Bradymonadaceae bacterium]